MKQEETDSKTTGGSPAWQKTVCASGKAGRNPSERMKKRSLVPAVCKTSTRSDVLQKTVYNQKADGSQAMAALITITCTSCVDTSAVRAGASMRNRRW